MGLFMASLAGACVHTVTRYYIPDPNNPRFDLDGATQVLDQYMSVQCPQRLAEKKTESGAVRLTITADTSGAVTRAELTTSSGDAMVDGLFGTVAAQLKTDSLRAPKKGVLTRSVRIGYSCAPNAAVATLEVLRK
jgi:TonB family protein